MKGIEERIRIETKNRRGVKVKNIREEVIWRRD